METKKPMFKMEYQLDWYRSRLDKESFKKLVKGTIANPLKYFCPNGAQEQYFKAISNSTQYNRIPIILSTYANGVGKSTGSINAMLNIIYKPQNGWFDYPFFHNFPFPKTIWYCSTGEAIKDTIVPEIERFAKPGTMQIFKDGKSHVSRIIFTVNGVKWNLSFKTFDQDPKTFESANVGCIEENERILMADGTWKKIIDIEVGDDVISYGSKYAWMRARNKEERMPKEQNINKVTAKIVHENREILEIKGQGGFSIKCTSDHRFWVYGKGWMEAQDIKSEMRLVRQDINIEGKKTCETWQSFLLGALIGDGCLTGKSVHFTSYNNTLNAQIRDMLPDGYKMTKIKPGKSRSNRQEYLLTTKQYKENQIKNWLKEIGIWGHKSKTKFIPDIIFKGNNNIKKNFVEALFATDGWFSGRHIGYASTSKRLIDDLRLLLQEMGINSNVHFKKKQDIKWNNQWFLIIVKSKEVIRFCKLIKVNSKKEGQNKVLKIALKARKNMKEMGISQMGGILDMSESLAQKKTRKKIKVISVKSIGIGNVVDIQTDPNHNFVINGIITHNCLIIDEPMPEELWKAVKSRRRKGCVTLLPMTPLHCPPYVLEEVQTKAEDNVPGYYHLTADVYSACKKRGIRGHLDADIIDAMVDSYDAEEIEARVFGKFMYFSGTIFPEFDMDIHKVKPSDYPIPKYSKIFQVSDPHDGRPSAIIWGAKTPTGRYIIFDELPLDKNMPFWNMNKPITAINEVKGIFDKELDFPKGYQVTARILDKRFGWQARAGTTLARLYKESGEKLQEMVDKDGQRPYESLNLVYTSSYNAPIGEGEIAYGHSVIRDLLAPMEDGKPGLVIWDKCFHAYNGLSHYIRQKRTGKSAEQFASGDGKIVEKYKDFPDAIRYLVCSALSPIVPQSSKTRHQKQKEQVINGTRNRGLRDS